MLPTPISTPSVNKSTAKAIISALLSSNGITRTNMQKEELPELVTNDGIPFPSRAVIGQLIDIYAELISAR